MTDPVPDSTPSSEEALPPPPTKPERRRRSFLVLIELLVVVVVVTTAAFSLELLRPPAKAYPNSTTAIPFSQARNLSDALARSQPGGPWELEQATGADLTTPGLVDQFTGCAANHGGENSTFLPDTTDGGSGTSPMWMLGYENSSRYALLVEVLNRTAQVYGLYLPPSITGRECRPSLPWPLGNLSGAIDSTGAAQAADALGAGTFLSNPQGVSLTMSLVLLGPSDRFSWLLDYSVCPFTEPGRTLGTVPTMSITLNGTTGSLSLSQNTTVYCRGTSYPPSVLYADGPIQGSIGLQCPENGTAYFDQCFSVYPSAGNVPPGPTDTSQVGLYIQTFDGQNVSATTAPSPGAGFPTTSPARGWYSLLVNTSGYGYPNTFTVLASYPSASGGWDTPTGAPVNFQRASAGSDGLSLIVVTSSDLAGSKDLLLAYGVGGVPLVMDCAPDLF